MKTIKVLLALLVLSSALLAQTGRDTIKLGNNLSQRGFTSQ